MALNRVKALQRIIDRLAPGILKDLQKGGLSSKAQQKNFEKLTKAMSRLSSITEQTNKIRAATSSNRKFHGVDPLANRVLGFSPEYTIAIISRNLVKSIVDWQATAAGLGRNLERYFSVNEEMMRSSPGGSLVSLESAVAGMKAGLTHNTQGTLLLLAQTKLTGQDLDEAAGIMANLTTIGKVSVKEMVSLATNIVDFGATYNVQTGELIKLLGSLAETSRDLSIIGGNTAALNEGVALLAAALGKQYTPAVDSLVKGLLRSDMQGAINANLIGVSNERLGLMNAKSTDEVVKLLIEAATKSGNRLKMFTDSSVDPLATMGIAVGVFGEKFVKDGKVISDRIKLMGEDLFRAIQTQREFGHSLEALRKVAIDPLVAGFTNYILPVLRAFSKVEGLVSLLQIAVSILVPLTLARAGISALAGLANLTRRGGGATGDILSMVIGALGGVFYFLQADTAQTEENTKDLLEETRRKNKADIDTSEFNMRANQEIKTILGETNEQIRFNLRQSNEDVIKKLDEMIEVLTKNKMTPAGTRAPK